MQISALSKPVTVIFVITLMPYSKKPELKSQQSISEEKRQLICEVHI
jgi:hypothetical protein